MRTNKIANRIIEKLEELSETISKNIPQLSQNTHLEILPKFFSWLIVKVSLNPNQNLYFYNQKKLCALFT